jgi:hypothetical protein
MRQMPPCVVSHPPMRLPGQVELPRNVSRLTRIWLKSFVYAPLSLSSTPDAAFGGLAAVSPQREFAHGLREVSAGSGYLRGSSGIQQALRLSLGGIVHCRLLCFCHTSTQFNCRRTTALIRFRPQILLLTNTRGSRNHVGDVPRIWMTSSRLSQRRWPLITPDAFDVRQAGLAVSAKSVRSPSAGHIRLHRPY